MPSTTDWYECVTLDACGAGILQDFMYVRATGRPRMRIISCTDGTTISTDTSHFFTVAYRIPASGKGRRWLTPRSTHLSHPRASAECRWRGVCGVWCAACRALRVGALRVVS